MNSEHWDVNSWKGTEFLIIRFFNLLERRFTSQLRLMHSFLRDKGIANEERINWAGKPQDCKLFISRFNDIGRSGRSGGKGKEENFKFMLTVSGSESLGSFPPSREWQDRRKRDKPGTIRLHKFSMWNVAPRGPEDCDIHNERRMPAWIRLNKLINFISSSATCHKYSFFVSIRHQKRMRSERERKRKFLRQLSKANGEGMWAFYRKNATISNRVLNKKLRVGLWINISMPSRRHKLCVSVTCTRNIDVHFLVTLLLSVESFFLKSKKFPATNLCSPQACLHKLLSLSGRDSSAGKN